MSGRGDRHTRAGRAWALLLLLLVGWALASSGLGRGDVVNAAGWPTMAQFWAAAVRPDLSAAHLRLAGATIEHLDWAECIRRYDRPATLFYCDPPYWGTAGYGVGFALDQYDRLAALARSIQGKMVISVNDIPEMRQAFAGLPMDRVEIAYTVGGQGRAKERAGELVIRKF